MEPVNKTTLSLIFILLCVFSQKLDAQKTYYKHFDGKSVYQPIMPNEQLLDKKDIFSTFDFKYYGDSIIGYVAIPKNEQRFIVYEVNGKIKGGVLLLTGDGISFEGQIMPNGDIAGKFWCDCLGDGRYSLTTFIYKETYAPNSVAFDHYYAKADTIIGDEIAEYHNLYDILLPKNYSPTNGFDTLTKRLLRMIFPDSSITQIKNNSLDNLIRNDMSEFCKSTLEMIADSSLSLFDGVSDNYDMMEIRLNEKGLLSTYYSEYSFMGGAHGLNEIQCNVFDIMTGNPIKLEDIITNMKTLSQLINRKAHSDFKLPETASLEEAGINGEKIEPTENFYVTREGIGFVYNEYEIGPYSSGRFEFMIPFIDLLNHNLIKQNSIIMRVAK